VSRVVAAAVIRNPLAGRFESDLSALFECGAELGRQLAEEAVAQLTGAPVSYGKAAIVGAAGDMEHGGAVIHLDWARRCEPRFKVARLLFRPM
jgi:hypothetical protein